MIVLLFSAVLGVIASANSMGILDYPEDFIDAERDATFEFESELTSRTWFDQVLSAASKWWVTQTEENEDKKLITFRHYIVGESEGRPIDVDCYRCLSSYIEKAPTIIIVHGYLANGTSDFPIKLRDAILDKSERANIIVVDWRELAKGNYYIAADKIRIVGKYIAEMIAFLVKHNAASLRRITYVGHSLGAQTANFVAANIPYPYKLERVFALDPAGPNFDHKGEDERIDASDGNYVIVVHTSAGAERSGHLGLDMKLGHIDFWPNGGSEQPGCPPSYIDAWESCSHSRSYAYLIESINSPYSFQGCLCGNYYYYILGFCSCSVEDTVYFNWDIPQTARGDYYFTTNAFPDYGQGPKMR